MEESRHYSRIYTYSIETAGQLLEGQIRVCSVDTDNPGDVGIYYIEIYPKEYYDWFTNTETSFDRLTLPGIYIYDESVRPYPPAGQNSRNKISTINNFLEALKNRDTDEA